MELHDVGHEGEIGEQRIGPGGVSFRHQAGTDFRAVFTGFDSATSRDSEKLST
ncbi:hypothetical protein Atai01_76390 [Amycolatopsis taiwanensis]|uniref:Uncharacterized protein n=1 Tax=Amycolatopsis taiwanensis TaxID=342230 RepID=A0A9W6RBP8_9PSEU|nr:hypothetical protein Atai01_76390 [Amycolatopsis taiwanensis]